MLLSEQRRGVQLSKVSSSARDIRASTRGSSDNELPSKKINNTTANKCHLAPSSSIESNIELGGIGEDMLAVAPSLATQKTANKCPLAPSSSIESTIELGGTGEELFAVSTLTTLANLPSKTASKRPLALSSSTNELGGSREVTLAVSTFTTSIRGDGRPSYPEALIIYDRLEELPAATREIRRDIRSQVEPSPVKVNIRGVSLERPAARPKDATILRRNGAASPLGAESLTFVSLAASSSRHRGSGTSTGAAPHAHRQPTRIALNTEEMRRELARRGESARRGSQYESEEEEEDEDEEATENQAAASPRRQTDKGLTRVGSFPLRKETPTSPAPRLTRGSATISIEEGPVGSRKGGDDWEEEFKENDEDDEAAEEQAAAPLRSRTRVGPSPFQSVHLTNSSTTPAARVFRGRATFSIKEGPVCCMDFPS